MPLVVHPTSTCDVCLANYGDDEDSQPHGIPCGHVFCRACLHSILMIRGSGGGVCPLCRKPFRDMTAVKKLHVDTFEDTLSAEVERERVERAVERAVHAREKEAAEKEREVLAKLVAGQDVEDQEDELGVVHAFRKGQNARDALQLRITELETELEEMRVSQSPVSRKDKGKGKAKEEYAHGQAMNGYYPGPSGLYEYPPTPTSNGNPVNGYYEYSTSRTNGNSNPLPPPPADIILDRYADMAMYSLPLPTNGPPIPMPPSSSSYTNKESSFPDQSLVYPPKTRKHKSHRSHPETQRSHTDPFPVPGIDSSQYFPQSEVDRIRVGEKKKRKKDKERERERQVIPPIPIQIYTPAPTRAHTIAVQPSHTPTRAHSAAVQPSHTPTPSTMTYVPRPTHTVHIAAATPTPTTRRAAFRPPSPQGSMATWHSQLTSSSLGFGLGRLSGVQVAEPAVHGDEELEIPVGDVRAFLPAQAPGPGRRSSQPQTPRHARTVPSTPANALGLDLSRHVPSPAPIAAPTPVRPFLRSFSEGL